MAKTGTPLKRLSKGGITPQKENSKGLYGKLGDKSIPVPNRLKLLRYAWKTHQVNLANKHQTLLHWMCNALHTKSQIKDEDKPYVWNCLHEVLNTVHLLKDKLYFKPSFAQVILDELGKIQEGKSKTSRSVVLASCSVILNTPGLNRLFLSQYETLVQIVAAVSQVCAKCMEENSLDPACEELFTVVVGLFVSNQVMKTNPTQNLQQFTTKLLPVVVKLVYLSKDKNDGIASSVAVLKDVAFKILFARDLLQYYESYLRLKTPFNESVYSPPKFIDALYVQLQSSLESPQQRKSALYFMPEYLEAFIKAYKPGENPVGFYQFVLLTETLKVEDDPDTLDALRDLLKVVQGQNVYNVTADIESEDKHIGWLKELAKKLVNVHAQHRNDASWYECFDWLLQISHSSVEGKVSALLTACLKSSQEELSPECSRAQNNLLCRLASIYGQLRQPNKLLAAIFLSLDKVTDANFSWPSEFVTALLGTLCSPPLTSVCQLWQTMIDRVPDMGTKVCFRLSVQLLSEFLLTMPLTDPSLTPIVVKKIVELMNETKERVIQPLVEKFNEDKDNMRCGTLHLILSWEKVMFLLCQTANVQPTLIEVLPITESVESSKSKPLQYLWKLLLIGRLRAETLFSFQNPEKKLWSCSEFLSGTSSVAMETTPWNLQILGLNEINSAVAKWDLILGHLPLIVDSLDQTQLSKIAEFLCDAVTKSGDKSVDRGTASSHDLALKFLQSPEFHEMTKLHGVFLSALLLLIGDFISLKDGPRPKKKRKSELDLFTRISNLATKSHLNKGKELKEGLENICEGLTDLKQQCLSDESMKAICRCLEMGFLTLPLEYLKLPDFLCCAVGVLVLTSQVNSSQVVELCVKVLLRSLENLHFHEVLQLTNSSSLVQMFAPHLELKVNGLKQFLNKVCRQICENHEQIEQLEPIVQKLCQAVSKAKMSASHLAEPECFVVLLKSFVKACRRSCPEKTKKLCKDNIAQMSPVAENLVKKCLAAGQTCAELCMETMATLVMNDKQNPSENVRKYLPEACRLSVDNLKSAGYSKTGADFICKVCDNKETLDIDDGYLDEILSALIDCLKKLEKDSTQDYSTLDLITIVLMSKSEVQSSFQDMLTTLVAQAGDDWMTSATVTLKIWQHLSSRELPEKMVEDFLTSSQQLMRKIQEMLLILRDYKPNDLVWGLQSTALQTETTLVCNYGGMFPAQCTVLALHGCQYVDLDVEIKPALSLIPSVFGILNTLLLSYPNIVFSAVPSFMSAAGYLLRSLIGHSQQNSVTSENLESLLNCAQDIDRLFSLIKTNQTDFGRVVPYLIAEYVQSVQKGTMHPEVKKCLSLAVHKLISICDEHSISLLHTTIPPGQRDIFGSLYHEYKKYYKYSGKV